MLTSFSALALPLLLAASPGDAAGVVAAVDEAAASTTSVEARPAGLPAVDVAGLGDPTFTAQGKAAPAAEPGFFERFMPFALPEGTSKQVQDNFILSVLLGFLPFGGL